MYFQKRLGRLHPWEESEEDQTSAGRTQENDWVRVGRVDEARVYAWGGNCFEKTSPREVLDDFRVCACAAMPCARAYHRCQRQRRIGRPTTVLGGGASSESECSQEERCKTRLSRKTPSLRCNLHQIKHACIGEEFPG